ncbi:MAG: GNAT family N-acetyltransferase [Chloroflexota bacterium]
MIRKCDRRDRDRLYLIINEAAKAYENVIPPDCYYQPYMSGEELEREMRRITLFGWEENGELTGVMGLEEIKDVTLIRHAYVLPGWQKKGIGSRLLKYLKKQAGTCRLLVGTWADARWAIEFYKKYGFTLIQDKDKLLKTYWDIPERQVETSVVLGIELKGKRKK